MNCMYCGAAAGHEHTCPSCGNDLSAQVKAIQISDSLYNRGLDKAQIRDLSGAIDLLERSLKYNKRNITARNLLGLIYFETGEVVSALSEWIISKNIKPADNIAAEYIEKLQSSPERLDMINQTVRRYNRALEACRDGNEDIAEIMLKKVLSENPHLIKAYHLLALIYIKDFKWEAARSVLKKAVPIDRTNSTTLRFLNEINDQIGRETLSEGEESVIFLPEKKENVFSRAFRKIRRLKPAPRTERLIIDDEIVDEVEERINRAETVQPMSYGGSSAVSGLLYIILGIVMGALVVWFLVVPSVRQDASRTANEQVTELNATLARQTAELDEKNAALAGYDISVTAATERLDEASSQYNNMEKLITAYNAFRSEKYDMAQSILQGMDEESLPIAARTMRSNLLSDAGVQLYNSYLAAGVAAYDSGNYPEAIKQLQIADRLRNGEYDVLLYLANSYRHSNDAQNAITIYDEIIIKFAGTQRAESAEYYKARVQNGVMEDSFASTAAEEAAILAEQQRQAEEAARAAAAAAEAARQQQEQQQQQQQNADGQNPNGEGAQPNPEGQTEGGQGEAPAEGEGQTP
ncbi:MAG: tetratricopeptide repeat protein [Lachnospiraceae bacterium]|nr:tetratricopeptide repeat protein [Lachnospiraceae bacterium]